jgi:hypothetical protein
MTERTAAGEPADDDAIVQRVAARTRAAGRDVVTDADPDAARPNPPASHR